MDVGSIELIAWSSRTVSNSPTRFNQIISRGNRREAICEDDGDRARNYNGMGEALIWDDLKARVFLGDADFITRGLKHANVRDDVNSPTA